MVRRTNHMFFVCGLFTALKQNPFYFKLSNFKDKMASEEQIGLSDFIKQVHKNLRFEFKQYGEEAWQQHLENDEKLESYSEAMSKLSTHWNQNSAKTENRITWTVNECLEYFDSRIFTIRKKEESILNVALNENLHIPEAVPLYQRIRDDSCDKKLRLLDVGSCFNPFQSHADSFDVTAIDIAPMKGSGVLRMDFLKPNITDTEELKICHNRLRNLPRNYFDVVVFSLLLEYLPSPKQRIKCCKTAYDVLDNEGILTIITPDSKHVGSNAKLMKNWRYTLALLGFNRIKFEKLQHVTCMVFRKAIHQIITERWSRIHKEPYMTDDLNIPQDFESDSSFAPDAEMAENIREFCDLKNITRALLEELPNC